MNSTPRHNLKYLGVLKVCFLLIFLTTLSTVSAASAGQFSHPLPAKPQLSAPGEPTISPRSQPELNETAVNASEILVEAEFDEWTVGGGYLYWATNCAAGPTPQAIDSHYALHRWPVTGGTPETIITASHTNCDTFRFLSADDDGVYFWDASLTRLMNYPIGRPPGQGGTVVRGSIGNVSKGLYLDNNNIYYSYDDRIRRVPKNGSENKLIHDTGSFIRSIAVDTGRNDIYWIDGNGLWYGRKNCSSPPCNKGLLTSSTGAHIVLGSTDNIPRTVYMVRRAYYFFPLAIVSYSCHVSPCQTGVWYDSPDNLSVQEIGQPAWARTGFVRPQDWLVWPERTSAQGRLGQKELDPTNANPKASDTRYTGSIDISMKTIIEGGQIYFADQNPGNESIRRVPIDDEPEPHDFGNLSQINNPALSDEWKPIVRVESEWNAKPNEIFLCTGTLIDPGIVITAGECLYDRDLNQDADEVRVFPAYANGSASFGAAQGEQLWMFDEFRNDNNQFFNIGWIKLDRPVGALTQWHNIGYADDVFMSLSTFNNPGYPRINFDSEYLHNRSGQFNNMSTNWLRHTAEAADMKGSPALNLDDLTIYGIESYLNDLQRTIHARLTQTKVDHINGIIANNTPTTVDLIPLKFRVPTDGGLAAGTWPTSASFILHNYSSASTLSNQTVNLNLYLSSDDTIEQSDRFLAAGSFTIQGALNGRNNFPVANIIWDGTPAIPLDTPPGNYWLGIILDEADAVPTNNATHKWDTTEVQILPPQMSVTPNTLTANMEAGDPPVERTVTVDILGNGVGNPDFNWTGTPNTTWLALNPVTGGDNQQVTITIDSAGLSPGTYHGQINFATDLQDGNGIPVASATVAVTLNLDLGEAVWQPEPTELNFAAIAGGDNPPSQALIIQATVDYPFNWIVEDGSPVTNDASWLPINSGAGTAPGIFNVVPDITGLAPGEYSTELVTHSPGQTNYALTTVNLTIHEVGSPQPILQLFPATLFYEVIVGQSGPGPQTFTIANIGTGQLNWTASSDVTWLTLNQSSGSGDTEISVTPSIGGLSPGTHVGQITVADGNGNQQVVRAVLQLRQPPTMIVDGTYLVFNGLSGQENPSPQNVTVRNGGMGDFDWLASETSQWLAVNPSQGSAPASVGVEVDTTNLDPGARQGNIMVTSPTALNSPQEIDVRLFLQQGPVLATAPQVLDFSIESGTSGAQKLMIINNASRGNMEWTAVSDANWLSLGQTAGVTGGFASTTVDVNINATNLSPRDDAYVGQITVRSGNGEGGPQTITVFLHVFSPARYCNIANGGQGYVLNSRNAKIRFTDVQRTLTSDGGCDFSATLHASLPQNATLESQVSGHVDINNVFVPTSSSPLELKVAILTLKLTNDFTISDEFGLKATGGQWKLPSKFGGSSKNFNGTIEINASGISLAGAGTFDLPDIDYGAMQLRQLQGKVSVGADWSYLVEMSGDMTIGIVGNGTTVENIKLRLDQKGFRSGQIGTFNIKDIAGVDIEVVSATFDSSKIRADKAILKIPKAWGGAEGALYGLAIDFDGNLTVTGGRFKLPSISAGSDSFKLSSLEGEFRSVSGGYEIQARGEFGMRGIGESGGCTLIVDVTIFSDNGARVLAIDSPNGQQLLNTTSAYDTTNDLYRIEGVEAIALRELTLGVWDCQPGLPIGPTGFELTGVQGTIKLRSTLEEVSLKVQIQSIAKLGTIPFISVEPQATLRPDPFFLGYEGPTYMTNMKISETIGKFENRRFSAEMVFDFKILHGGLGINAGMDNDGDFYLGGNGWADVSVKKGSIFKECAFGLCVNIPPFSLTVAEAEAKVDLTHVYGSIKVLGYGAGFKYNFRTSDFDIFRASRSFVITSEDIRQARLFRQNYQGVPPAYHSQIAFADSESVLLTLPVNAASAQSYAVDVQDVQLAAGGQSDVLFILAQPINGQLGFVLIDPNGEEYTQANLPENIQFEQAIVDGTQQTVYGVAQAQPGDWQTRVEGDVDNTDFAVFESVSIAPSALDNITLAPTGNLNEVEVQWQHVAQEATPRIKVYANPDEIEQTITYTNAHGVLVSGVTDKFVGEPVAEFNDPFRDGRLETAIIDLNQLPSGNYAFWIEAEGVETPGVRCYIRQNGSGCAESMGAVARFTVDHSSTFPSSWDPDLQVDEAIQDGLLHASWTAATHPDVDHYLLTVRGEGVLRPGQETFAEINVPLGHDPSGRVTASVDNIEPGETYRLTLKAVDEDGERSVQSSELVVVTTQPDFVLSNPNQNVIVLAGGNPQSIFVDVEMSSNLPYDPLLFVDYGQLADGIYVEFANESVADRPTARAKVYLSAAADLPPGHYLLPLGARSGELERTLNLSIEVVDEISIYLPMVFRD